MATLTVRTIEQAAAWLELDGQISDGFWENARPQNHWKPWCDAEVKVAAPGDLTGRDFYAQKSNYDFSAKELLDVVGKRMLGIVRIARGCGLKAASILEHAVDCETGTIDWTASWNSSLAIKQQMEAIGVHPDEVNAALADETYTMAHLRADLNELKQIMRNDLRNS